MAVPFKIPRRKQPSEADSMHMQSPLSRLQDTSSPFETSWCNGSSNGKKPGSLNGHISRAGKESTLNRLVLSQSTVQRPAQTPEHCPVASQRGDSPEHSKWREPHMASTLRRSPPRCQLAVNGSSRKQMESLTHKKPLHIQSSPVTSTSTHKTEQRLPAASPPCFKNGWRPKRASDTLCRDRNQETGCVSPLLKTLRSEFTGDSQMSVRCSPVESSEDSASEPSPERVVDRDPTWRRCDSGVNVSPPQNTENERTGSSGSLQNRIKRTSGSSGMHPRGIVPVPAGHQNPPNCPLTSGARGASTGSPRHRPSAVASVTRATQEKLLSISRPPLPANPNLTDRERRHPTKCLSLHLRLRRPKATSTEPIVLSSEDEECHDNEEECPRLKTPQQSPRQGEPTPEDHVPKQMEGPS